MAIKNLRRCRTCGYQRHEHTYYPDNTHGGDYEYWQCSNCGTCWYKCNVHKTFTANRSTDAQKQGVCECASALDTEE